MIRIKKLSELTETVDQKAIMQARYDLHKVLYYGYENPELDMDFFAGKTNVVKKYFDKYNNAYNILKNTNVEANLVRQYEVVRDGYEKRELVIRDILNCVKVGESQDSAVKKLAKLTKTLKHFDIPKSAYTINFFDVNTEDEILQQINMYNGHVKLFGMMDFNIVFKDGKVKQFYF